MGFKGAPLSTQSHGKTRAQGKGTRLGDKARTRIAGSNPKVLQNDSQGLQLTLMPHVIQHDEAMEAT